MKLIDNFNIKNFICSILSLLCFINIKFPFSPMLASWSFYIELLGWLLVVVGFSEYLVPLEKKDYKKFFIFAIQFFAIIFIYTIARQVKDSLIVASFGGEGSTICKILVLFVGLFYPLLYQKMVARYGIRNSAYIAMLPFATYFILHAFVLYNNPYIVPAFKTTNRFLLLLNHWPDAVYYAMSEMFATIALSIYFWQTANHFHNKEECKRIYPVFMIVAQFATLLTSGLSKFLCTNKAVVKYLNGYSGILKVIALIITLLVASIIVTNYLFFKNVPCETEEVSTGNNKSSKPEISLLEVIKQNPKMVLLALLSFYYGVCTLWIEQFWKTKAKQLYPNDNIKYQEFASYYFLVQSRISLIMTILGSSILLNYIPWLINALITPVIVYIAGFALFGVNLLGVRLPLLQGNCNFQIVAIGIFIVGLFKSAKYSSFDTTKEYFLVSTKTKEERGQIKQIEGYISRQGKSLTALIMGILFSVSSLSYKTKSMSIILWIGTIVMASIWCYTVFVLNNEMVEYNNNQSKPSNSQNTPNDKLDNNKNQPTNNSNQSKPSNDQNTPNDKLDNKPKSNDHEKQNNNESKNQHNKPANEQSENHNKKPNNNHKNNNKNNTPPKGPSNNPSKGKPSKK